MNNSNTHHERIAKMIFASVCLHYLAKVENKGRTKQARYSDKFVDELAKDKKMEKILKQ